jgi:hypothetical protein
MTDLIAKSRARIQDLMSDLYSLVQTRYNQSNRLFTVASAWGQILFVLENLSQMNLFFIEDSITELNVNTASRESSIKGLITLAGHNPTRAVSAKGEIQIRWNGTNAEDVGGNVIIIPKKARIKSINNGLEYLVLSPGEYYRLSLDRNSVITAPIIEGLVKTASFTGTGVTLQSYNLPASNLYNIENFEVDVFVNDEKWTPYLSLYDMPRNAKGVIIKSGVISGIDIFFGNFNFGAIPPSGSTIRVEYIETSGNNGNINVSDSAKAIFNFVSDGFDLFGNDADLRSLLDIKCTLAPSLGRSGESLELTRLIGPKTSKNYVLANSDSYVIYFQKFGIFSIIEAFNTYDDNYIDDDSIIYVILVPDVSLKLKTNETYFDIALSEFKLTTTQRDSILQGIEESGQKVIGTEIVILDPIISRYVLNIVISIFENYDKETIMNQIVSLCSDYFISIRRRDKIPRSDLIALIESVKGVDSVSLFFVSEKNETNKQIFPIADDIGLDQFGDIILEKNEVAIISGGWSDRNGVYYDTGANLNKLSSINIELRGVVKNTFNTDLNAITKTNLKNMSV